MRCFVASILSMIWLVFFQEATPRRYWIDMNEDKSWYQTFLPDLQAIAFHGTAVLSVYVQDYTLVPSDDTRPLLCAPGMTPTGWAFLGKNYVLEVVETRMHLKPYRIRQDKYISVILSSWHTRE